MPVECNDAWWNLAWSIKRKCVFDCQSLTCSVRLCCRPDEMCSSVALSWRVRNISSTCQGTGPPAAARLVHCNRLLPRKRCGLVMTTAEWWQKQTEYKDRGESDADKWEQRCGCEEQVTCWKWERFSVLPLNWELRCEHMGRIWSSVRVSHDPLGNLWCKNLKLFCRTGNPPVHSLNILVNTELSLSCHL